jgi:hypothetical protein
MALNFARKNFYKDRNKYMLMNFTNYFNEKRTLNYKPFLLLLFVMFLMSYAIRTKAQTTLSAGDVALSSYNSEGNNDSFAFMLTRSIASGTKIVITDGGWNDGSADFSIPSITTDWFMEWEATSAMNAGDQVQIWNPAASTNGTAFPAVSAGKINKGRMLSLATSGDQIFIIQGPTIDSTSSFNITGGTVICGLHSNYVSGSTNASNWDNGVTRSQNTSELPPGLTTGTNCVLFNYIGVGSLNEVDNVRYTCVGTTAADLNDSANWDYDDAAAFSPTLCTLTPTWNGTSWSIAPNSGLSAVINSSTTPGAFSCKNLTINNTFALTLGKGVTATIYGDLTNNGTGTSDSGTLRFAGTAQALNGTAFTHRGVVEVATGATLTTNSKLTIGNGGSLMHGTSTPNGGGAVSGSITFEKTIGSTNKGWRMFSLPVDALIDSFENGINTLCSNHTPSQERNVYYYDPTGSVSAPFGGLYAAGWTQANNTTDDENKAYSIFLDNTSWGIWDFSTTVSITGTPNDGTKTFNLQYTYDPASAGNSSVQRGWNQIPNHFPSNLSVYNLINDGNFGSTYKAVHIWDQGSSQMIGLNQSSMNTYNNSGTTRFSSIRQISPFMAFWVKATSTSQSIQLKNAHRTSNTDSLPANTYFKTSPDVFGVTVKDADNHFDQLTVLFDEGATEGMDYDKDIYKFKSLSDEVPTLYTMINGSEGEEMLSFNALPIKESYSMPLYIESYTDGKEYTFNPETKLYNNFYDVELVDNKTGAKTMLLENNYKFNFDAAFKGPRFTLNFNKKSTTGIEELYNQEKTWAYTNDGGINVVYKNNNAAAQAVVEVYNIMGQKLYTSATLQGGETVSYKPAATNGQNNVYIVKVISNGKAQSIKVIY